MGTILIHWSSDFHKKSFYGAQYKSCKTCDLEGTLRMLSGLEGVSMVPPMRLRRGQFFVFFKCSIWHCIKIHGGYCEPETRTDL